MPICPRCGSTDLTEYKSWDLKGGKAGDFVVKLWQCNKCGKKNIRSMEKK